ncbi:MAG: ABC transporter ATP-binding protein [Paraglaciecola sp.]|nr:ABC transporter ATP-binding protein [Paraglaciecola sp.]NCT48978.1 ABC transporter ATP-binding protein [Paraglaciecola sp.]
MQNIYSATTNRQIPVLSEADSAERSTQHCVARVAKLAKTFQGKVALNDVDLNIMSGQVVTILGANGAGKTTLINILLGRMGFDHGEVSVFGQTPGSLAVKRQTGAMLQVANLPETLKISEHIQLFQAYYPNPMPYQQVLDYAGLNDMQERFSRKLSGGEKQRLLFALSICGNPKLLFLDEPSVGMDVSARQGLWQAIRDLKAKGTAIVLTTHYLQEAENLADHIVLLKEGEIIKRGNSDEFKASVSAKVIRFCSPHTLANFSALPAVLNASQSGKYISLQSSAVNQSLQALLQCYPDIEDLSVSGAGLEDAFLHLNSTPLPLTTSPVNQQGVAS